MVIKNENPLYQDHNYLHQNLESFQYRDVKFSINLDLVINS